MDGPTGKLEDRSVTAAVISVLFNTVAFFSVVFFRIVLFIDALSSSPKAAGSSDINNIAMIRGMMPFVEIPYIKFLIYKWTSKRI